jgi:hypothetical protein
MGGTGLCEAGCLNEYGNAAILVSGEMRWCTRQGEVSQGP